MYPNGKVVWTVPFILTVACAIDPRYFPFDRQECDLRFGSWVYDTTRMDLVLRKFRSVNQFYVENGVWDVSVTIKSDPRSYEGYDGEYAEIIYTLWLTRRPAYYIFTVITPCFMLSLINLMVFVLPTESGEKVSLGITNVLALVLFQQLIGQSIPPVSDKSPYICKSISFNKSEIQV